MKAGSEPQLWWLALLGFAACGGQVDLGNRAHDNPSPGTVEEPPPPPDDPFAGESEPVLALVPASQVSALAVAGDSLYLSAWSDQQPGLFRCQKTRCAETWERLPTVKEWFYGLQVVEQRLAGQGNGDRGDFFASYGLPDATDRQTVIDGLPVAGAMARFHRGFVYFGSIDRITYRCELPSCEGGPRKILDGWSREAVAVDGDWIFAAIGGLIHRIAGLGDGPVERLLPDAALRAAPPESDANMTDIPESAELIATSTGMLYATVKPSRCQQRNASKIVRWPALGGPREELFDSEGAMITALWVFDNELVWRETGQGLTPASRPPPATLASCRVEACSSTLRHPGTLVDSYRIVASDDERLYWIEPARQEGEPSATAIRGVRRLPVPDGG